MSSTRVNIPESPEVPAEIEVPAEPIVTPAEVNAEEFEVPTVPKLPTKSSRPTLGGKKETPAEPAKTIESAPVPAQPKKASLLNLGKKVAPKPAPLVQGLEVVQDEAAEAAEEKEKEIEPVPEQKKSLIPGKILSGKAPENSEKSQILSSKPSVPASKVSSKKTFGVPSSVASMAPKAAAKSPAKASATVGKATKAPANVSAHASTKAVNKDFDPSTHKRIALTKPLEPKVFKSSKKVQEVEELVLRPYQEECFKEGVKKLQTNNGVLCVADPRVGKGVLGIALGERLGLRQVIICPPDAVEAWKAELAKYGIDDAIIITFATLGGKRDQELSHPLLKRIDSLTKEGKHKVSYEITDEYQALLDRGILFIVDEFFKIRNGNNNAAKAIKALLFPIVNTNTPSRYYACTATPFVLSDNNKPSVDFLKIFGYIRHKTMYNTVKGTKTINYEGHGLEDVLQEAGYINQKETDRVLSEMTFGANIAKEVELLCCRLLVEVMAPALTITMKRPSTEDNTVTTKNGFYRLEGEHNDALIDAVSALKTAVFSATNKQAAYKQYARAVEHAKLEKWASVVAADLEADLTKKAIICHNYPDSVAALKVKLSKYHPATVIGNVATAHRGECSKTFIEDPKCRVFITTTVLALGKELRGKKSNRRVVYVSPHHELMSIEQALGRGEYYGEEEGDEEEVPTEKFIFYGHDTGATEIECIEHILESTHQKSENPFTGEQMITMPRDYEIYIEPEAIGADE